MLIPHKYKNSSKKDWIIDIIVAIFIIFIASSLLFTNLLPLIYAADDYILTSGSIGGTPWNDNLIYLQAGRNYYFTFRATESILITAFTMNIWAYNNTQSECDFIQGVYCIFHIDFSIYEASASNEISPSNVLIKTWEYRLSRENVTFYSWELKTSVTDNKYYSTKNNAYVALAFSPSIDITVNGTSTTNFTLYEDTSNNDMIIYLRSSFLPRIGFYATWSLLKGALSEEIAYPISVSIYNPKTIIEAFAIESGFSYASVGIAAFSFILLSLTLLLYKKGVEVSAMLFGILTLSLSAFFGLLQIIPIWFAIPTGMISLSLITYERISQFTESFER